MRVRVFGCALTALLILLVARTGRACKCGTMPPPPGGGAWPSVRQVAEHEIRDMDLVFEGVAERVGVAQEPVPSEHEQLTWRSPWGSHIVATFHPSVIYKGPHNDSFLIRTPIFESACGFDFDTGQKYLVFAEEDRGGNYFTTICHLTELLERAGPALRLLRGEPPVPEDSMPESNHSEKMISQWTGTICGRVTLTDGRPAADADVLLFHRRKEWIRNAAREADAGTDGSFCFEWIDSGEYLLGATTGLEDAGPQFHGYYADASDALEATPVKVKAGISGSGYNFVIRVRQAFKVRGRVAVNSKEPPPWDQVHVFLERSDGDILNMAWRFDKEVGPDRIYEFENVLPGRYTLIGWVAEDKEQVADEVIIPAPPKWNVTKMDVDIQGDTNDLLVTISPVM